MKDNYLDNIRNEIITTEAKVVVRNYKNNLDKLTRNYNIGKEISEAGKHYGEGIIKKYAVVLTNEFGKGFDYKELYKMLKFFHLIEKVGPPDRQLTWSHYIKLLPLKNINEIRYYIDITIRDNLSKRQLSEKIKSDEYHRLPEDTRNKLLVNKEVKTGEEILNPIIIHTSEIKERFNEKVLQELIMDDLNNFLSQLGEGFTYVRNEYKLNLIETNNYIDILLYNIKSNRYCVVELKVRELKREDIGQRKMYMNYIGKIYRR